MSAAGMLLSPARQVLASRIATCDTVDVTDTSSELDAEYEEALPPWFIRNVPEDIRYRVKVQAAIRRTTVGELVTRVIRDWLDDHAPEPRATA